MAWLRAMGKASKKLFLYNEGDTCDVITGGYGSGLLHGHRGYVNFNETNIEVHEEVDSGVDSNAAWVYTKNFVNLDNYKFLYFDVEVTGNAGEVAVGYTLTTPSSSAFSGAPMNNTTKIAPITDGLNKVALNSIPNSKLVFYMRLGSTGLAKIKKIWLSND